MTTPFFRSRFRSFRNVLALALFALGPGSLHLRAQSSPRPLAESAMIATSASFDPDALRSVTLIAGERLSYDVKFGAIRVGSAAMEVREVTDVRGRAAWHTIFSLQGGIPFFRVDDRLESWIDTKTFASLRFEQSTNEGRYHRRRSIELFPERRAYIEAGKNAEVEQPSVALPLDDGSFLYFLRAVPFEVGQTYEFDRYFRPDRNPVRLTVLRRETITVRAGTFETIVVQPTIKTPGIFSENGRAEVWVTDDARHLVVQMKAKLPFGSISLYLKDYAPGEVP